jgi:hypothetical protein
VIASLTAVFFGGALCAALALKAHAGTAIGVAGEKGDTPFFKGLLHLLKSHDGDICASFKPRNCHGGNARSLRQLAAAPI